MTELSRERLLNLVEATACFEEVVGRDLGGRLVDLVELPLRAGGDDEYAVISRNVELTAGSYTVHRGVVTDDPEPEVHGGRHAFLHQGDYGIVTLREALAIVDTRF